MIDLIQNKEGEARQLMESVLRDGSPLGPEYPLVFGQESSGSLIAIGEGEVVQSACTILAREFRAGDTRVRGGMIGSVSTAPELRGRGLATRTIIEAEARLQIDGCAFVLLWGEEPSFYLKRGYSPAGVEHDFLLNPEVTSLLPASDGVREVTEADVPVLHSLYSRHSSRIERTVEEMAEMLTSPGMTVLVNEVDGEVVAYAVRGRGVDLQEAIHEWGGEPQGLLPIVRAHLELGLSQGLQGLILMVPSSATDLRCELGSLGIQEHTGILGLGKILDRVATAKLIDECLGDAGTCELISTEAGERFQISGPNDAGVVDDGGAMALLFPTVDVRPAVEQFLARFGFQESDLPLSLFAWGLDSI